MMKKIFIVTFLLGIFSFTSLSQETKKVLFIGNSYTFVNNLPDIISNIALSMGDTLIYDSSTPGGFSFQQHTTYSETLTKINSENWDYVILQEQSQKPSFSPSQVNADCIPYAEDLVNLINANDTCTIPLFYMTWGRKNGDQTNCQSYPPVCTYEGMQQRLRESYLLMGSLFSAEVAPVGAAWQQVRINNPGIELYAADESHPSIAGSFLAACVFYSSIFHKYPITDYIPAGIIDTDAAILKTISQEIVFDSLETWLIDTTHVTSSFIFDSGSSPEIHFTNQSLNAEYFKWRFGDGETSYDINPVHTYQYPGNYTIELFSEKGCEVDSSFYAIEVTLSVDELANSDLSVYPNPSNGIFQIYSDNKIDYIEVTTVTGYLLQAKRPLNSADYTIDISRVSSGVYLIKIYYSDFFEVKKIIVE